LTFPPDIIDSRGATTRLAGRRTLGSGSLAPIIFEAGRCMGAECNTTVIEDNFFLRIQHEPSFLRCQIRFLAHFMPFFFLFEKSPSLRSAT